MHVYLFVIIRPVYADALRDQQGMSVSDLIIQTVRSCSVWVLRKKPLEEPATAFNC